MQLAKWTREQAHPMSSMTGCVLGAMGPEAGHRIKSQGLLSIQKLS